MVHVVINIVALFVFYEKSLEYFLLQLLIFSVECFLSYSLQTIIQKINFNKSALDYIFDYNIIMIKFYRVINKNPKSIKGHFVPFLNLNF